MIYIGEAANKSGASVKAIRHYDGLGMLSDVKRSGSYRVLTERDIGLIRLIKKAQGLGFKLSELRDALLLGDSVPSWGKVESLIKTKELQITEQINKLEETRTNLAKYSCEIRNCILDNPDCSDPLF